MLQKIPTDIENFNKFITETDDLQFVYHEYLIPKITDGKWDYTDAEKKIDEKCRCESWEWTKDESKQWSEFRRKHNDLYNKLASVEGEDKNQLTAQLNANISSCIEYDKKHKLIEGILFGHSYGVDRETFGVQQDVMEFETPLRKISFLYEKEVPLTDLDKKLIDKYVELNNQLPETTKYVLKELNALNEQLPGYWERLFICKEKANKASNTICFPSAFMKGSYSPAIQVYIPTAEEQQQYIEDFNTYINDLIHKLNARSNHVCEIQKLIFGEYEEDEKSDTLFDQVNEMFTKVMEQKNNSLDICTFDEDFEDYKGVWSDERKKMEEVWEVFIKKDNVFGDVYQDYYDYIKSMFTRNPRTTNMPPPSAFSPSNPEVDELRMETIQRYESNMDNVFMDADDWHIILDNFQQKRDEKSKAAALKKALTQHPESETLLLRKAGEEVDKHEYKKALELVNRVEKQNEGHHPNFFMIKANILCKLHAPNEAIPLYNKLIAAQGIGMEWFHENARIRLIDIYKEQKNYSECIRLDKELLEIKPDDVNIIANICGYYRMSGMHNEAEQTALNYLKEYPESTECMEQLGHLYCDTKEYEKAIEMFEKSYELNKAENYNSLFHKGNLLVELKRFDEAAVCFETCILHYHLDKDFHLAAAKCFAELNMPYVVEYHQRKLLDLDPELSETLNQIQPSGN